MYNDRKNNLQNSGNRVYVETRIDNSPSIGCMLFALVFMAVIILGVISAAG